MESFINDPSNILKGHGLYIHEVSHPNNLIEGSLDCCSIESTNLTSPSNAEDEEIKNFISLLGNSKKIKKEKQQAPSKRGLWSPEDDTKLLSLIEKYGEKWAKLARMMPDKGRRQIRNRFMNALRPGINWEEWTEEEERQLYELHEKFGNKWCIIADHLPGRTENQVKNKYYWNQRHNSSKAKQIVKKAKENIPKTKKTKSKEKRPKFDDSDGSFEAKIISDTNTEELLGLGSSLDYLRGVFGCDTCDETESRRSVSSPIESIQRHDSEGHLNLETIGRKYSDVDKYLNF